MLLTTGTTTSDTTQTELGCPYLGGEYVYGINAKEDKKREKIRILTEKIIEGGQNVIKLFKLFEQEKKNGKGKKFRNRNKYKK